MNLKSELIDLMFKSEMNQINDDEAVDRLEELHIKSGLTEKQFMKEITKVMKQIIKEVK